METNNTFSVQRLMLLSKQSMIINKKLIGISLAGFAGVVFFGLILLQSAANFVNWDHKSYMVTFIFLFFQLGLIYSSLSFPSFRSKEKSMTYLMLPATASEKFVFEFLTRIVVFIILMPLLFWTVSIIEGYVVHYFVPEFIQQSFFMGKPYLSTGDAQSGGWIIFLMIQAGLFVFIAPFAGASHFSKSPLLKTLLTLSIIAAGYGLFTFLMIKGLNLKAFHPANHIVLFMNDKNSAIAFFAILATAINLCLLSIAYFKLKEKEA